MASLTPPPLPPPLPLEPLPFPFPFPLPFPAPLDPFPIFDRFLENVYMIADANHGYKMIGVGELVAKEILGTESDLLKPFRFNRYEKGELHPTSNSPFPWS